MLAFEDFVPGQTTRYGSLNPSRDDLVAFARDYDAQPMHVDEAAARDTLVGELIGSGWHSCAMMMRMLADNVLNGALSMGAPGIEEVKWLRPVKPGMTLSVRQTVLDRKHSLTRPEIGLVQFRFELLGPSDEPVVDQVNWIMFGKRTAGPLSFADRPPRRSSVAGRREMPADDRATPPQGGYFEDCAVGQRTELGRYTFEARDIIRFARQFDPQPFHLDAEAARHSLLGGLCASGWHTAAIWMKLMVAHRQRVAEAGSAARLGPSPGFRNLVWRRPVFAGDTISYSSTLTDLRPSASRPGWGLVFHRNEGVNQNGDLVFAFDGCVFWERRPS